MYKVQLIYLGINFKCNNINVHVHNVFMLNSDTNHSPKYSPLIHV